MNKTDRNTFYIINDDNILSKFTNFYSSTSS